MRYGTEHKAQTRQKILHAAAQQLRAKGPGQVAVADVMAGAGLTHGGFYAHFGSKDALVAEALDTMFGDAAKSARQLDGALADPHADIKMALRGFLAGYLSPAHRDSAQHGCPLPALAGDMARSPAPARDHFGRGLAGITMRIEQALDQLGMSEPGSMARTVVAQIVGAVALARAVGDTPQSAAILQDNLRALEARLGL